MATKYLLVLEGRIEYCPKEHIILYFRDADCLTIKLDAETRVKTRGSKRSEFPLYPHDHFIGNELWANGERYWVRLNRRKGRKP